MADHDTRPTCPACGHAVPHAVIEQHATRGAVLSCPTCGMELAISMAAYLVLMAVCALVLLPMWLLFWDWGMTLSLPLLLWMAYYGNGWALRLSRWFGLVPKPPDHVRLRAWLALFFGSIGAAVALAWWLHEL